MIRARYGGETEGMGKNSDHELRAGRTHAIVIDVIATGNDIAKHHLTREDDLMKRWAWLAILLLGLTLPTGCGQKGSTTAPDGGGGKALSEEEITKEIEKLGGDLGRKSDDGPVTGVSIGGKPETFRKVLPYLKKLPKLESLELPECGVTDADLKELASLTKLEDIDLALNKISGAGIKNLAGLKNLKSLVLDKCGLRDDDAAALASLTQLEVLQLIDNPITNAGAKELHALKNLSKLNLTATKVDDKGVAELKKALPKVEIAK